MIDWIGIAEGLGAGFTFGAIIVAGYFGAFFVVRFIGKLLAERDQ